MKEGTLVLVPSVHVDVFQGSSFKNSSYGIILGQEATGVGGQSGYKVWVFDTKMTTFYDEYWINPLT